MILNEDQIEAIKAIINKHFNAFLLSTLGVDAITQEDLRELQRLGILGYVFNQNLFRDAFNLGKQRTGAKSNLTPLNYEAWRKIWLDTYVSTIDKQALDNITASSEHYTKKLKDGITNKMLGTVLEANRESSRSSLGSPIGPNPYKRITQEVNVKKLAKELEKQTKDSFRDWERVVTTELNAGYSQGAVHAILEDNIHRDPNDIIVYMEGPLDEGTCKWCKKFYHEGNSFKTYRLTELLANGTNVGRKASEWKAVVPPMHSRCRHRIVELPQGFSLDENGKMFFAGSDHHELNNPIVKSLQYKVPTFSGWKLQDRYTFQGMKISIERKAGSFRYWKDRNGKSGKTKLSFDYGYIRNTLSGLDGDHLDCVHPSTLITLGDLGVKEAKDLNIGDELLCFDEIPALNKRRKFKLGKVEKLQKKFGKTLKITLEDGTNLITTPGHLNLVMDMKGDRHIEWVRTDQLNMAKHRLISLYSPNIETTNDDYKRGYLYGAYLGDGCYNFENNNKKKYAEICVLADDNAILKRVKNYWAELGVQTTDIKKVKLGQTKTEIEPGRIIQSKRDMEILRIYSRIEIEKVSKILDKKELDNLSWCKGFLAGIYDTDGSFAKKHAGDVIFYQIKNKEEVFKDICDALIKLNFRGVIRNNLVSLDKQGKKDSANLRLLSLIRPALMRKKDFSGVTLSSKGKVIKNITPIKSDYIAIQTDCGTYIANGLTTHNCYIGPNEDSKYVFIVHQLVPSTKKHDEEKVMLGFDTYNQAKEAYLKHYDKPDFFGGMTTMHINTFKRKVLGKETTLIKGMNGHKYVKRTGGPGNYRYWYKLPNGALTSSDKPHHDNHAKVDEEANTHHKDVKEVIANGKKTGNKFYETDSGEKVFIDKDNNEYMIDRQSGEKINIDKYVPTKKIVAKPKMGTEKPKLGIVEPYERLSSGKTVGDYQKELENYGREEEIKGRNLSQIEQHFQETLLKKKKQEDYKVTALNMLDEKERDALDLWTSGTGEGRAMNREINHDMIRAFQRGDVDTASPKQIKQIKDAIKLIEESWEALPPYNGTLFRGLLIESQDMNQFMMKMQPGTEFETEAFTSFTKSKKVASEFGNVHLIVKKNTQGKDVSFVGDYQYEEEVLVKRGTKYRVASIDDSSKMMKKIYLEEVNE